MIWFGWVLWHINHCRLFNAKSSLYIRYIGFGFVTANSLKSQNGTLFSHVWRRGRLALDPSYYKSSFRVFHQAYRNWHIMWGINLWLNWPPLARGSKFHTIHTPTKATSLPPLEQWKIWTSRFRRNNINYSSWQFRFPVWYFKGINRTILSKIT